MNCFNTEKQYGFVSKLLHWLIALLVIGLLCVGISFSYIPKEMKSFLMPYHKATGVTVFILMIIRIVWALINRSPKLPEHMLPIEKIAAKSVHGLLYLTVLLMPLSGIIMSLAGGHPVPFWGMGNITLPFIPLDKSLSAFMKFSHTYLAWTIGGLVVIHTAAALKHHFYDRDDVLKRMM